MERDIEYGRDIIVGVVHDGRFQWYATEKELWFLDQVKWSDAFVRAGYAVPEESDRFGIDVVNEENAEKFLAAIDRYRIDASELQDLLKERQQSNEGYEELLPALLVDFDKRRLMSMFPEPSSFEDYVPDGWTGSYAGFLDDVPPQQRYWIVEGRDMLHP